MEISRRQLIRLGLLNAGAASVVWNTRARGQEAPAKKPVRREDPSVIQGATDETQTQFSIVYRSDVPLSVAAVDEQGVTQMADRLDRLRFDDRPQAITKAFFRGLRLGQAYRLILRDDATGRQIDERAFRTLDTQSPRLRFAICTCMDDGKHTPEIWRDLLARRADFILFGGDCVYCDKYGGDDRGEPRLWRRHAEARATLEIYFSRELIPIFATWDDHDYGHNDASAAFPYRHESQENFRRFFAQDPAYCAALEAGPGIATALRLGEQQFLLMDDRTWRIAGSSEDRYAHWGEEQEAWFTRRLQNHAGMSWIVNGSQFFPQMPLKESFSGQHAAQFAGVLEKIRRSPGRAAFISGDVHFSEVSRIEPEAVGYQTYELTSSSIHSQNIPGVPGLVGNRRRIASVGQRNYMLVDSTASGPGSRFHLECRSAGDQLNFALDLEI